MTQLIIARKAPGRSLSFSRRVPGGFSHTVPWGVGPGCPLGTVLGAFFQLFQPRLGLPGACCHLCHERGGLSTIWMMTGVALTPSTVTPRRGTHRSPAPNCTPCMRPSSPHSPGCARTGGCSGMALGCSGTALGMLWDGTGMLWDGTAMLWDLPPFLQAPTQTPEDGSGCAQRSATSGTGGGSGAHDVIPGR